MHPDGWINIETGKLVYAVQYDGEADPIYGFGVRHVLHVPWRNENGWPMLYSFAECRWIPTAVGEWWVLHEDWTMYPVSDESFRRRHRPA